MLKWGAFLVEFVDEKIQNTRGYYIQIQFAMYALKVQCIVNNCRPAHWNIRPQSDDE